jgi:hypothetical protein
LRLPASERACGAPPRHWRPPPAPYRSRRRSAPCGREAPHVPDRAYDPSGQYGTYAEDLGEGGAGSFHLGLDAPVEVRYLSIQRPDVAQDLRGQPPAEAGRGALGPYASQDARGPVGRKGSRHPSGDEVPQKPVEAALSARVRSATRSSRLSESRRSASEPTSGSTAARRPLREAASAVARASSPSFLRALPVESTRTRAESLGGTSTTDSPVAASLPARCLPRARQSSPWPNDARGTASPSARGTSSLL